MWCSETVPPWTSRRRILLSDMKSDNKRRWTTKPFPGASRQSSRYTGKSPVLIVTFRPHNHLLRNRPNRQCSKKPRAHHSHAFSNATPHARASTAHSSSHCCSAFFSAFFSASSTHFFSDSMSVCSLPMGTRYFSPQRGVPVAGVWCHSLPFHAA